MTTFQTILIVEGPAGSGKTTLIKELSTRGFASISSSLGVRAPDPGTVIMASAINDWSKVVQAVHSDAVFVAIDRLVLSQQIYGHIRANLNGPTWPEPSILYGRVLSMFSDVQTDMKLRLLNTSYHLPPVDINFLFVLPTFNELVARRGNQTKPYPFDVELEYSFYTQMAEQFRVHVPLRTFIVSDVGLTDDIIREIKNGRTIS